jgi:hypothetical protein
VRRLHHVTAAVLLAGFGGSCTAVREVPKDELLKLNGFQMREKGFVDRVVDSMTEPPEREIIFADGGTHDFDQRSLLVVEPRGGEPIEGKYRSISVTDGVLRAVPMKKADPLDLRLADVESAGVRQFSLGRTLGLAGGIAGALVAGLIVLVAVLPEPQNSGGSSHDFD